MHRTTRLLLAIVMLAGCDGRIGDAPLGTANAPRPPADPNRPGVTPSALCATPSAGPLPLRRLTRVEYDNTVRALLGTAQAPAREFVEDELVGTFHTNVTAPVSEIGLEQYTMAAEALAREAVDTHLDTLLACDPATAGEDACAAQLIETFGRRAFKRPLTSEERSQYDALFATERTVRGFTEGIRLVLAAFLTSPYFLYHALAAEPAAPGATIARLTPHSIAERLAFFLWRRTPDDELLDAAERGDLDTPEGVESHVERLVADERALPVLVAFHAEWLGLDELANVEAEGLDDPLRAAMRAETEALVEHVMRESASFTELMTATYTFPDSATAPLYGRSFTERTRIELDPTRRIGVFMQPSMLTAYRSPVLRGKMVRELLLCQGIPPPPPEVNTDLSGADPTIPPRQRWEAHSVDPACAGCHGLMDPIGFAFGHYDTLGRWRDREEGFDIDTTGSLIGTEDSDGPFEGAVDLLARLSESDQTRECFARQWVRFAVGRALETQDECLVATAADRFRASGYDVRALVTAIATSEGFLHVGVTP